MSKAKYSEICQPHFGLGIEKYCHFTSPIRRLSDLATHRIIKKVLLGDKAASSYAGYAKRAAAAATEGELRAIAAERSIEDLYKCIFMSKFIGEEFEGRISSVTSFGLFVMLDNTCEGLIPISEMPFECRYDEKNVSLTGRNFTFRLGDKIRIKVEECDTSEGKVRFSLAR
jgi:ribonuclease R